LKRRLIVLNVALAALIAGAAWRLRQDWVAGQERDRATLHQPVHVGPPPPVSLPPKPEPVTATKYGDIAQKMLFTKDRNPVVVIEAPPPKPEPPMPALPLLHGVMNLPSGAVAIMSENATARDHGVRAGEPVGEFKLVSVDREKLSLEWHGKVITKTVEELLDRRASEQASQQVAASQPAAAAASPPPAIREAEKGPPPPNITSIPKDAVPTGDGSSRYTDAQGRTWVLRQTPFGLQKFEEKSGPK
jgi:hypothetical protein